MKLLLKIAFLGTSYCGYQVQNNGATIQGTFNEVSLKLFGYECDIVGCSRTDSGVHANEFYLSVTKKGEDFIECSIPLARVPVAFNSLLPDDISVLEASYVPKDFHPRYSVKYKEYIYKIWNGTVKNPFDADRAYKAPLFIDDETLERMNAYANRFVGTKDFASFMASGSKIVDTTRNVKYAEVYKEGDYVIFKVAADGFLYNMVRIMVGTLLDNARVMNPSSYIDLIIESKDRSRAGATAPSYGLYLNKVVYDFGG